jgi:hypothetical protein
MVYVDDAVWPFGRMLMAHLIADTPEELWAMVDKIGVARKWEQAPTPAHPFPHFDICKAKRRLAIEAGAEPCSRKRFVEVMDALRKGEIPLPAIKATGTQPELF